MLDGFDRRILTLLQADADTPVLAIADAVGLSPSACSRRIVRLRQDGYISRRVAILGFFADAWPARVGQTEDLGYLIKCFADGVIASLAEQAVLEVVAE